MKKLIFLLLLTATSYAQTSTRTLSEKKIGLIKCKSYQVFSEKDTNHYVSIIYQNFKYTHITDICCVLVPIEGINSLISDLKSCESYFKDVSDNVRINKPYYIIQVQEWHKRLTIREKGVTPGYTYLTPKQVKKLIEYLQSLE